MNGLAEILDSEQRINVPELKVLYDEFLRGKELDRDFIDLIFSELSEVHRCSSWLLKQHIEEKGEITDEALNYLIEHLEMLSHWESRLVMAQSLPLLDNRLGYLPELEDYYRSCVSDQNKFIRAWGYHGLYVLAKRKSEMRPEVETLLQTALIKEAPSIRARIRNTLRGR